MPGKMEPPTTAERPISVGGTSAGMAAMPQVMTLYQSRRNTAAAATVVPGHGLGLFDRAIVEQHFDGRGGRLERFTGLLRDADELDRLAGAEGLGKAMVGIAVEERTALVMQRNRVAVIGTGRSHVFLKSPNGRTITWHVLADGETARLERDADLMQAQSTILVSGGK